MGRSLVPLFMLVGCSDISRSQVELRGVSSDGVAQAAGSGEGPAPSDAMMDDALPSPTPADALPDTPSGSALVALSLEPIPTVGPGDAATVTFHLTRVPGSNAGASVSVSFAAPLGVVLGGTDAPTCADGVCSLQLSLGEGVAERQLAFTLTQANSASMSLPLNVTSADAAVQSAPTLLVWQVSVAAWSDMFDDPSTLSLWAELEPGRHDRLEISGGQLVLEPVARQQEHWYADNRGAFVARRLHGDFLVEARVQAVQRHAPLLSPTAEYNGAGLLVRVPSAGVGNEQWLSFNTGMQQVSGGGPGFGRETKITTPGQPSSHSVRYLNAGPAIETLRLCRIGAELRVLYWNGSAWREELRSGATFVVSTGPAPLATGSPLRFDASAWGDDVDVGLMAGNFFDSNDTTVPFAMPAGGEFQTRGLFDYVRFRDIVGVADCAAP